MVSFYFTRREPARHRGARIVQQFVQIGEVLAGDAVSARRDDELVVRAKAQAKDEVFMAWGSKCRARQEKWLEMYLCERLVTHNESGNVALYPPGLHISSRITRATGSYSMPGVLLWCASQEVSQKARTGHGIKSTRQGKSGRAYNAATH